MIIDTIEKVFCAIKELSANDNKILVIDTETTGLNVRKDKVIGVGFAFENNNDIKSYYIPIYEWNSVINKLEHPKSYNPEIVNLFLYEAKKHKVVCHNAAFDLKIIKNFFDIDLLPYLYCDTMLLKHTVDEEFPFGLKDIAVKFSKEIGIKEGILANQDQLDLKDAIKAAGGKATKNQYDLFMAPMNIIAKYCMSDCELTIKVYNYFIKRLEDEKLETFFFADEVMPLYKEVTIPMETAGIPVDVEYLVNIKSEVEKEIGTLKSDIEWEIHRWAPDFENWFISREIDIKPSGRFAQYYAQFYDLPLSKTPSGSISLKKADILKIPNTKIDDACRSFLLGNEKAVDKKTLVFIRKWGYEREFGKNGMFNINSKDHLRRIFFHYLKQKPLKMTPQNLPQLDDDFLISIKDKFPFVVSLLAYNKLFKIKTAYIDRILEGQENGIFYPSFMQHRTITGRYGSDLQQLPRSVDEESLVSLYGKFAPIVSKYTNIIRGAIKTKDTHCFVGADYESLEPRLFASVAKEPALYDIFNNGEDFYSTIAIKVWNLRGVSSKKSDENYLGKIKKNLRQMSKAFSLGIPYGLTAFKLSKDLNIPIVEAESIVSDYYKTFPSVHNWMLRSEASAKTKGYIQQILGRKQRFSHAPKVFKEYGDVILDSLYLWKRYNESPPLYSEMKKIRRQYINDLNSAKNFQIQSLAASIVNRASIAINRKLRENNIKGLVVCQVHDELITYCDKDSGEEVKHIMKDVMENIIKLPVKLPASPNISSNFKDLK